MEFLFSTLVFCILNVIQRFIIPPIKDQLFSNTKQAAFQYRVNKVKIDPCTNQTLAFYGPDSIRRPGLFQPIDFNILSSCEENIDFENMQTQKDMNHSLVSGISGVTQFSLGGASNLTSSIVTNGSIVPKTSIKSDINIASLKKHSLDLSGFKSWIFDANLWLKLVLTFKCGMLFGVTECLFMAGSMFVPFNLSILIHSFVLFLITIHTKIFKMERIDFGSIVFASLAVLSILPFCVHPFKGDKLYWDNTKKVNGTEYIIISLICDCIGAICIFWNIVSISNLCNAIKPSKMRFENDREPSIIEIAFFISLWASFISLLPCLICDVVFHSENILTSNISSNYSNQKSVFEALFFKATVSEYISILVSVGINSFYMFAFIACLSILTMLSVAILYEFIVITHAILYFNFISKHSHLQKYHTFGLICAYVCCVMYLLIRIIQNKRYLKLNWNQYFTRQNRINSSESFNTLLSQQSGRPIQSPHNKNNLNLFQSLMYSPSFNKLVTEENNNRNIYHKFNNANMNNCDDEILSIETEESTQQSLRNNKSRNESKTFTVEYTPTEPMPQSFAGPNAHNNNGFGLPHSYVIQNGNATK